MIQALKRTYEKVKKTTERHINVQTLFLPTLCIMSVLFASGLVNPAECSGVLHTLIAATPMAYLVAAVGHTATYFQTKNQTPLPTINPRDALAKNLFIVLASGIGYGVAFFTSKLFMPQHEHDEMGMHVHAGYKDLGCELLCLGLILVGSLTPWGLIERFWTKKQLPKADAAFAEPTALMEVVTGDNTNTRPLPEAVLYHSNAPGPHTGEGMRRRHTPQNITTSNLPKATIVDANGIPKVTITSPLKRSASVTNMEEAAALILHAAREYTTTHKTSHNQSPVLDICTEVPHAHATDLTKVTQKFAKELTRAYQLTKEINWTQGILKESQEYTAGGRHT